MELFLYFFLSVYFSFFIFYLSICEISWFSVRMPARLLHLFRQSLWLLLLVWSLMAQRVVYFPYVPPCCLVLVHYTRGPLRPLNQTNRLPGCVWWLQSHTHQMRTCMYCTCNIAHRDRFHLFHDLCTNQIEPFFGFFFRLSVCLYARLMYYFVYNSII